MATFTPVLLGGIYPIANRVGVQFDLVGQIWPVLIHICGTGICPPPAGLQWPSARLATAYRDYVGVHVVPICYRGRLRGFHVKWCEEGRPMCRAHKA